MVEVLDQEKDLSDFQIDTHEAYLAHRTEKITKVQSSLQKIHKMYETLNEIVQE